MNFANNEAPGENSINPLPLPNSPGHRENNELIFKLQALSNAFITISSELELETVLQNIADTAREFAGAQYAALGIVDWQGIITSFITSGLSKEEREKIGDLPRGHGLLGVLIKQGKNLRVRDMSEDPRRSGFPPNHPPMTSLLGVPVSIQGRIVGDLYLTDKIGAEEFSDEDEWWITIFARQAAVAVENANLYKKVRLAQQRAETMAELTGALNRAVEPQALFEQITRATCQLLELPAAALYLLDNRHSIFKLQAEVGLQDFPGQESFLPLEGSVAGDVLLKNAPKAVEDISLLPRVFMKALANELLPSSLLVVPIRQQGQVSGVLEAYSVEKRQFSREEIDLLEAFAGQAAFAMERTQLYQQKEEFLSMTAHDLRAPLTAIKMSSGLLEISLPENFPEALKRLISNIGRNSERLGNLLDDLLDLTRLEQGKLKLNLERLELGEAIAAAGSTLQPLFEEKQQEIIYLKPLTEYWIEADRRRLEQVLVNLLVNAHKYSPPGRDVEIKLETRGDNFIISIRDTGPGIPPEEQSQIFDRYYRRALHEKDLHSSGSGMGLPIARNLVELHKGRLWVESQPGQGSVFLVELPQPARLTNPTGPAQGA